MSEELQRWADDAMYEAEPMSSGGLDQEQFGVTPKVHILSATKDPLGAIAAACRMYEGKATHDLADITDEQRRHYWEQSQATHLKAPLEFVDLHFFIEGVDRAFTHQLVRQRTAVYAQESLRFAVKEHMASEVALPPTLTGTEPLTNPEEGIIPTDEQKARDIWDSTVQQIEDAYNVLVNMGMPAEDARGLLPHCTTTRLHYKTNLRNLLEHAGNRLCTQAQFAWRIVLGNIVSELRHRYDLYPLRDTQDDGSILLEQSATWQWELITQDTFRPVCFAVGKCPFNADFDRGCTIRERVDDGRFDEISSSEWLLDPAAARRS
jgi:flavin-dependent thymidylate synthase